MTVSKPGGLRDNMLRCLLKVVRAYLTRAVLSAELKAKERVLQLVQHPDADVQKAALLATQKILLSKDKVDYLSQLT